jgi:hypothetical protein
MAYYWPQSAKSKVKSLYTGPHSIVQVVSDMKFKTGDNIRLINKQGAFGMKTIPGGIEHATGIFVMEDETLYYLKDVKERVWPHQAIVKGQKIWTFSKASWEVDVHASTFR